jgi:sulfhydrogenase subunit gamma (sulfur reductase)
MNSPYTPQKAEIMDIIQETQSDLDIKTFKIKLVAGAKMDFLPGQFVELSVPGSGEAPFGFASAPQNKEFFELTIKRTGQVTEALHSLKAGSSVWIRGPFGNHFPLPELETSKILIIAGGLGLAPLRPLIFYLLDEQNRPKYGEIQMLLAARSPQDFPYQRDFAAWRKAPDTKIALTIDRAQDGWDGLVGFPHNLVADLEIDYRNTYGVFCGPPLMIKAVSNKLMELGMPQNKILTTLEMRMTCGVGKCGKCNVGHRYVCIDGPVFSMDQLADMPGEY